MLTLFFPIIISLRILDLSIPLTLSPHIATSLTILGSSITLTLFPPIIISLTILGLSITLILQYTKPNRLHEQTHALSAACHGVME